jgi:hypothetical protein
VKAAKEDVSAVFDGVTSGLAVEMGISSFEVVPVIFVGAWVNAPKVGALDWALGAGFPKSAKFANAELEGCTGVAVVNPKVPKDGFSGCAPVWTCEKLAKDPFDGGATGAVLFP